MEHFGVATLCHISRSQEQRNMACNVLAWCETLVQNQHLEEGGEEEEKRVEEDELAHENRRKSR